MLVTKARKLAPVCVALGHVALEGGLDGSIQALCRLGRLVGADLVATHTLCLKGGIHLGKLKEQSSQGCGGGEFNAVQETEIASQQRQRSKVGSEAPAAVAPGGFIAGAHML